MESNFSLSLGKIAIRVATVVFGALPAMTMCVGINLIGLVAGLAGFANAIAGADGGSMLGSTLLILWCGAAYWGTYGLFAAALGPTPISKVTVLALLAGIAAIALFVLKARPRNYLETWQLYGPVVFGVAHLIYWGLSRVAFTTVSSDR